MKKRKTAVMLLTVILCGLAVGFSAFAADTAPGSEGDPVVTRSYVDQRISEVMRVLEGAGSVSQSPVQEPPVQETPIQSAAGAAFTPVLIEMGQTIYGGEGAEMILRTGAAHIVTSTDTVVNVTTGIDLKHGAPVPKGNLLIFPRADGRGVKAADSCWLLVKGAYTVE